jgi:hypothetical protein
VTRGRVFHDDVDLQEVRERLSWYPHDVWLYVLASCGYRLGEDEVLVGRAGSVGDALGSSGDCLAHRARHHAPRPADGTGIAAVRQVAWLGSAFGQLPCSPTLMPMLERVGLTLDWRARDAMLAEVYVQMARMHNELGRTAPVSCEPRPFCERPFTIIGAANMAQALVAQIGDPAVRTLADRWLIGSIDLVSDNHAFDDDSADRPNLLALYVLAPPDTSSTAAVDTDEGTIRLTERRQLFGRNPRPSPPLLDEGPWTSSRKLPGPPHEQAIPPRRS